MPIENIRFVVSGANPQTKTVQVNVNPITGAGSASFVLNGKNSGTDSIQAFMDSQSLSSNHSQVNWQQTNGALGVGPVTTNFYSGTGYDYTGLGSLIGGPHSGNSLVFNQVAGGASRGIPGFPITGFSTTDGNTGAYKRVPMSNQQQSFTGSWVSDIFYSECNGGFNANHQGSFVATEPGNYSFYFLVDDSWVFFIGGGCTRVSGPFDSTVTSKAGLPQVGARMGRAQPVEGVDLVVVNIPAAGIYPFEIGHGESNGQQTYLVATYSPPGLGVTPGPGSSGQQYGQDILPIAAIQSVPPTVATGTGNLLLTPTGGVTNLLIQGSTITLNLQIQNIKYTQKPYIPLLEGTTGSLMMYSDPNQNTFTLPEFNNQAVNPTAAGNAIFTLAGDNASWKNRLLTSYEGGNFVLEYNGSSFDPNVQATQLTITNRNIAWYNPANQSFDLFSATGQGGGASLEVEVDYQVQPVIASILPSTLPASGGTATLTVTLAKPLHAFQATTVAQFVGMGGLTVQGTTQILNSNGQITGWALTVTVPLSSSTITCGIDVLINGIITYLQGTAFVTNSVTYINNVIYNITVTGSTNSNPQNYQFLVTSDGQNAAASGIGVSTVFTCTISAATNGFGTVSFVSSKNGGTFTPLGSASPTNIRQTNGIWQADYSLTKSTITFYLPDVYKFGYNETQTGGGSIAYTSSTPYVCNNDQPDSGGGGTDPVPVK